MKKKKKEYHKQINTTGNKSIRTDSSFSVTDIVHEKINCLTRFKMTRQL